MRIQRLPATLSKTGLGRTALYAQIGRGIFPRGIKIGERATGWIEAEIDAVLEARARGVDEQALRQLVDRLHCERSSAPAGAA